MWGARSHGDYPELVLGINQQQHATVSEWRV
jgi:hypothetical protein